MVTIGIDAHKRVHQAVALDDYGALLGSWRGANTVANWQHPGSNTRVRLVGRA